MQMATLDELKAPDYFAVEEDVAHAEIREGIELT
jgi:hypothetical protein